MSSYKLDEKRISFNDIKNMMAVHKRTHSKDFDYSGGSRWFDVLLFKIRRDFYKDVPYVV